MKGKTNSPRMKNLLLLFLIAIALFTATGCGNNDGDGNNGPAVCTTVLYSERVPAALETFTNAVTAYTNDPSTSNCEAYRNAAQGYLDVLREFETCTFLANDAEYQESVREAQQEVNDIDC